MNSVFLYLHSAALVISPRDAIGNGCIYSHLVAAAQSQGRHILCIAANQVTFNNYAIFAFL